MKKGETNRKSRMKKTKPKKREKRGMHSEKFQKKKKGAAKGGRGGEEGRGSDPLTKNPKFPFFFFGFSFLSFFPFPDPLFLLIASPSILSFTFSLFSLPFSLSFDQISLFPFRFGKATFLVTSASFTPSVPKKT